MTSIRFTTAVVGRSGNRVSIALLAPLPRPFDTERVCVAILECSLEAAEGLCQDVSSAVKSGISED